MIWFLAGERKAGNQLAKSEWVNRMASLDDLVKEAGVELWTEYDFPTRSGMSGRHIRCHHVSTKQ